MTDPLIVTAVLPHLAHAVGTRVRLRVALYPTPVDDTPLWEDRLGPEPVDAGGTVHLVLGVHRALPVEVFERFPRWLSVSEDGATAVGPRIPVSGAALRHAARLDALERNQGLLGGDTHRMLARLPSRLRTLGEGFDDVHARLVALEDHSEVGAAAALLGTRVDGLEARVARAEDGVEDLAGAPHGEVVQMAARVAALESRLDALAAAVARVAETLESRMAGGLDGTGVPPREG